MYDSSLDTDLTQVQFIQIPFNAIYAQVIYLNIQQSTFEGNFQSSFLGLAFLENLYMSTTGSGGITAISLYSLTIEDTTFTKLKGLIGGAISLADWTESDIAQTASVN